MRTRADMEAIIARGESVLFDGKVIKNLEDLPGEAAVAIADPSQREATEARLKAVLEAAQAQLAELKKVPPPAPESDPVVPGPESPPGKTPKVSTSPKV